MNKLAKRRGCLKAAITRAGETINDIESCSSEQLMHRLEKLEQTYKDLNELSQQMYEYEDCEGFVDPVTDICPYDTRYWQCYDALTSALDCVAKSQPRNEQHRSIDRLASQQETFIEKLSQMEPASSLGKIRLPVFTGNYAEWPSFCDLFQSSIGDRAKMPDVQKFHYLKSYLSGDALQLIKHLAVTGDNYPVAWERLEKRYNRKQFIVKSFVLTFLSLPAVNSTNATALRKLSDGAEEVLRGLDALHCNNRDPWLIQILMNKADDNTKAAWAERCDGKTHETIDTFLDFLSHRCDTLEASAALRSPRKFAVTHLASPVTEVRNNSSQQGKLVSCVLCHDQYMLSRCPQFQLLDVAARRSFTKKHNLCFNCLRTSHQALYCTSTFRCRHCRARHHTLVHMDV